MTMKVANILYTGLGGVSSVVYSIIFSPGSEEYQWLMCYYGVVPIQSTHIEICERKHLDYAVFRPYLHNPWKAWFRLCRWLISKHPDAIICHSITAVFPCIFASKFLFVPLIVVEHTPNEVKTPFEWLGSLASMLFADRVVILTSAYEKILSERLGFFYRPKRISLIPNGICMQTFSPALSPHHSPTITVGMAGRFSRVKRQDLLIDVTSELGIKLKLAGSGETDNLLRNRAASLSNTNVIFNGLLTDLDMPEWFRSLHIYLHASDGETQSMSILQAMASGLPIVASDLPGMKELLGPSGQCALIVPNTKRLWVQALQSLILDPSLRLKLGHAARLRAQSLFDSSSTLRCYLNLLNELRPRR